MLSRLFRGLKPMLAHDDADEAHGNLVFVTGAAEPPRKGIERVVVAQLVPVSRERRRITQLQEADAVIPSVFDGFEGDALENFRSDEYRLGRKKDVEHSFQVFERLSDLRAL